MKKKRFVRKEVDETIYNSVLENPIRLGHYLESLKVKPPQDAEFLLACLKLTAPRFDLRFYSTQDDFLMDYTSCLLQDRDDYVFHCFRWDGELTSWEPFLPPPVIGLGMKTRIRPGTEF